MLEGTPTLPILRRRTKSRDENLDQLQVTRDWVWSMRQQMLGRQVALADLFGKVHEDGRRLPRDHSGSYSNVAVAAPAENSPYETRWTRHAIIVSQIAAEWTCSSIHCRHQRVD